MHLLPNASLVRLRGFVQDLPNPELYLGVAKLSDGSLVTTKFSDGMDARLSNAEQIALWDRKPVVLVPAPCSPWVDPVESHATLAHAASKATPVSGGETLVYMYDEQDNNLALHDLVEVIGVLSRDEEGDMACDTAVDVGMEDDQDPFGESKAFAKVGIDYKTLLWPTSWLRTVCEQFPPQKLTMFDLVIVQLFTMAESSGPCHPHPYHQMVRVHAIITKAQPSLVPSLGDTAVLQPERIEDLRASAIRLIGRALGGDLLAAEYLLMLSIEKVTSR